MSAHRQIIFIYRFVFAVQNLLGHEMSQTIVEFYRLILRITERIENCIKKKMNNKAYFDRYRHGQLPKRLERR